MGIPYSIEEIQKSVEDLKTKVEDDNKLSSADLYRLRKELTIMNSKILRYQNFNKKNKNYQCDHLLSELNIAFRLLTDRILQQNQKEQKEKREQKQSLKKDNEIIISEMNRNITVLESNINGCGSDPNEKQRIILEAMIRLFKFELNVIWVEEGSASDLKRKELLQRLDTCKHNLNDYNSDFASDDLDNYSGQPVQTNIAISQSNYDILQSPYADVEEINDRVKQINQEMDNTDPSYSKTWITPVHTRPTPVIKTEYRAESSKDDIKPPVPISEVCPILLDRNNDQPVIHRNIIKKSSSLKLINPPIPFRLNACSLQSDRNEFEINPNQNLEKGSVKPLLQSDNVMVHVNRNSPPSNPINVESKKENAKITVPVPIKSNSFRDNSRKDCNNLQPKSENTIIKPPIPSKVNLYTQAKNNKGQINKKFDHLSSTDKDSTETQLSLPVPVPRSKNGIPLSNDIENNCNKEKNLVRNTITSTSKQDLPVPSRRQRKVTFNDEIEITTITNEYATLSDEEIEDEEEAEQIVTQEEEEADQIVTQQVETEEIFISDTESVDEDFVKAINLNAVKS